ncbi:hypothetical protein [Nonomuraea sp. NPDC005650]|uniref:hypothetical protein n=1 Tax=Nonomuraea sp. NPDC005650 TaxID=3157045 RepID=UPI0033A48CEC
MSDRLTIMGAVLAQGVSAQGMWLFFGDVLDIAPLPRFFLFAFIEVAALASALRGQDTMRRTSEDFKEGRSDRKPTAGVDGIAVWVFAAASGVFSALDAGEFAGALFRLASPLIAAWLWERSLATASAHITGRKRSRINWRISPERVLVRIGLADPTDRSASEVSAQHHLMRLAITATRARALVLGADGQWLPLTGRGSGKRRRALKVFHAAHERAMEYASLTRDPERRRQFLADLDALMTRDALLTRRPRDWMNEPEQEQGQIRSGQEEQPAHTAHPAPVLPAPAPPAPAPTRKPYRRPKNKSDKGAPAEARTWFGAQLRDSQIPAPKDLASRFSVSAATGRRWHGQFRALPEFAALIAHIKQRASAAHDVTSGVSARADIAHALTTSGERERVSARDDSEHAHESSSPAAHRADDEAAEREVQDVIAALSNGHHTPDDVTEPLAPAAAGSPN